MARKTKDDFHNQRTLILKHLQSGKTITQLTALLKYGCMRLAPRIFELRQIGYAINTGRKACKGGHYCAEYSLQRYHDMGLN